MRFTTFAPTGVTMMLIGLVLDVQFVRRERGRELAFNPRLHGTTHFHTPNAHMRLFTRILSPYLHDHERQSKLKKTDVGSGP